MIQVQVSVVTYMVASLKSQLRPKLVFEYDVTLVARFLYCISYHHHIIIILLLLLLFLLVLLLYYHYYNIVVIILLLSYYYYYCIIPSIALFYVCRIH